ncbi:MAG: thiamine-phosphate kinase [Candidatus Bathyarchaeota archaeon]|nr:thiamine-phosphate kinase [Candidatus Bathyarchaeota archaeon]
MRTIGELGEKKVIAIIKECLDMMPNMPVPFGDDVSAVQLNQNTLAVVKTDMLVGKTDVPPDMSLRQAARKAVVMNISDFASKGVQPLVVLASLGLPKSLIEKDVKQIGIGLNEGAREYDAYIVGGDTNEASDLIISCSLLGVCDKQNLVTRSGAKPGDIVAVTGHFGKTASGLKILLEDLTAPERIRESLTEAVFMPRARLREGLALARTGALTASIDSSDGLAWSLCELSDASNVGFRIDGIPIAPEAMEFAEKHDLDPWELALYGGEEYELVVTVKPEVWEKANKAARSLGTPLTRIGNATEEERLKVKTEEETRILERRGWEHFKR